MREALPNLLMINGIRLERRPLESDDSTDDGEIDARYVYEFKKFNFELRVTLGLTKRTITVEHSKARAIDYKAKIEIPIEQAAQRAVTSYLEDTNLSLDIEQRRAPVDLDKIELNIRHQTA